MTLDHMVKDSLYQCQRHSAALLAHGTIND